MAPVTLDTALAEQPPQATTVGIIYPPPEVRNIVDKTASFVARNGPEFEQRIKQNEVNNPKFNFLSPGDPYHAYYQHRVVAIRDGMDEGGSSAPNVAAPVKQQSVGKKCISNSWNISALCGLWFQGQRKQSSNVNPTS